jgi:hypothetical protein
MKEFFFKGKESVWRSWRAFCATKKKKKQKQKTPPPSSGQILNYP